MNKKNKTDITFQQRSLHCFKWGTLFRSGVLDKAVFVGGIMEKMSTLTDEGKEKHN